jgi:hypothetical protein
MHPANLVMHELSGACHEASSRVAIASGASPVGYCLTRSWIPTSPRQLAETLPRRGLRPPGRNASPEPNSDLPIEVDAWPEGSPMPPCWWILSLLEPTPRRLQCDVVNTWGAHPGRSDILRDTRVSDPSAATSNGKALLHDSATRRRREIRHWLHASERLEERGTMEWQVVVGLEDGELIAERPNATPNPAVEVQGCMVLPAPE